MPNVKISTPTQWQGRRYEANDVINVDDRTHELNIGWMTETTEPLTPPDSRPTVEEFQAAAEAAAVAEQEKADKAAAEEAAKIAAEQEKADKAAAEEAAKIAAEQEKADKAAAKKTEKEG
jgi:hypothetical protein